VSVGRLSQADVLDFGSPFDDPLTFRSLITMTLSPSESMLPWASRTLGSREVSAMPLFSALHSWAHSGQTTDRDLDKHAQNYISGISFYRPSSTSLVNRWKWEATLSGH
jgi:hypothetical protein